MWGGRRRFATLFSQTTHDAPQEVTFEDFNADELHLIWKSLCRDQEWECTQDVSLVASRRVARGIGRKGFGNARAVSVVHV